MGVYYRPIDGLGSAPGPARPAGRDKTAPCHTSAPAIFFEPFLRSLDIPVLGDFRGPAIDAAGTRHFEPDGVVFCELACPARPCQPAAARHRDARSCRDNKYPPGLTKERSGRLSSRLAAPRLLWRGGRRQLRRPHRTRISAKPEAISNRLVAE
jgi:hypothetical protein